MASLQASRVLYIPCRVIWRIEDSGNVPVRVAGKIFWLSGICLHWCSSDGSLLQAVTALAFTDDGAVLVSAGEDTVACAWLLMDVLDASPNQGATMQGPPTLQSW